MKIISFILTAMLLSSCLNQEEDKINYLNQRPPGMKAELFAPGLVSSGLSEHSAPAFSADGRTVIWTVMDTNYHGYLLEMKFKNGEWSTPARPSFSDSSADDYYASFTPDGRKLLFGSRRKSPPGYPETRDMRIWEVEYRSEGWGNPKPFDTTASTGMEYAHSISPDGTVYFSSVHPGHTGMNIRKSDLINGRYTTAQLLPFCINSIAYEDGPYISPDGSFLIFESQRPESINGGLDLYISFSNGQGQWGLPVNMGSRVNSASSERFARLSPDGKYLFFGSSRDMAPGRFGFDIYWISSGVIEEIRHQSVDMQMIQQPLASDLMDSLDKTNIENSSLLLKDWIRLYPDNLSALIIYISTLRKRNRFQDAEKIIEGLSSGIKQNPELITEWALIKFGLKRNKEADSLLIPVLVPGDRLRDQYIYISNSLIGMKQADLSEDYFSKAMAISSSGFSWFERAKAFAENNEKEKAYQALYKATELGGLTENMLETEPSFDILKNGPEWTKLKQKIK